VVDATTLLLNPFYYKEARVEESEEEEQGAPKSSGVSESSVT
jgi:hypothetical protein